MTSQHDTARRDFSFGPHEDTVMDVDHSSDAACFGSRLRAKREARGLDLESCAHNLKLPARVLRQLESNQLGELDHAIYLGSYISKYARFLGLDEASIQAQLQFIANTPPTLVATGGISHSRYLLERYTTAATYVVLTAVIMVPMIWLGVRGTLDHDISRLAPLDSRPVAQQDAPARTSSVPGNGVLATAATPVAAPSPAQEQPLLASMASFPELTAVSPSLVPPATQPASGAAAAPVAAADAAGGHSLTLSVTNPSWVEVLDSAGSRLEYGLLPAGSSKTYHSENPLVVRIGNANGAQVSIDGQPVALDAYRRANIAHFRVELRDGKATPASM
jgi:cytoskeleton protein RodZ